MKLAFLYKLFSFVLFLIFGAGFFFGLFQSSLPVLAVSSSSSSSQTTIDTTCNLPRIEIKWWNALTPGNFLPIIPDNCSTISGSDGSQLRPLSLTLLPAIVMRLYGFLISLAFVLILPVFMFAGIRYMWGGINSSEIGNAKKTLIGTVQTLVILSLFYTIVFGVISLLGGINGFNPDSTSLDSFFSL